MRLKEEVLCKIINLYVPLFGYQVINDNIYQKKIKNIMTESMRIMRKKVLCKLLKDHNIIPFNYQVINDNIYQ